MTKRSKNLGLLLPTADEDAAIAAGLAHGLSLIESIELAKAYVSEALRDFAIVGQGRGPLHHGGWPTGTEDQTTTEVIAGP